MTFGNKNSILTRAENLDRIRQLSAEGVSRTKIARQLGVALSYISIVCRWEGIVTARHSKVDIDQLRHMAAEGKTQDDIARKFGVSPQRVSQLYRLEGIATIVGRRSKVNRAQLRQMAAEGKSCTEIANCFAVSQLHILRICKREGIAISNPVKRGVPPKVNIAQLRQMAAEGKTKADIAHQFGVAKSHIYRICKREGITTRKPARRSIPSKVNIAQLRKMAAEGMRQADIAQQFGVSKQRISEICKREGITTRKPAKGGAK